jgi:hypothetical protein
MLVLISLILPLDGEDKVEVLDSCGTTILLPPIKREGIFGKGK